MTYLCITPERQPKTGRIMHALKGSFPAGKVIKGKPPRSGEFVVWGHLWLGEQIVPKALVDGTPFWFVDNGFWKPANGGVSGYYSLTYRWILPMLLNNPDMSRLPLKMRPWKQDRRGYILVCMPGLSFGKMFGWNMETWCANVVKEIKKHTDRKIVIRDKASDVDLSRHLSGAAVVITHSSKVAIDAVTNGIPCIVEPTNPAAPVCGTDLSLVENPLMPDREVWWASLMCQQFTLDEMKRGIPKPWIAEMRRQWEHSDYSQSHLVGMAA